MRMLKLLCTVAAVAASVAVASAGGMFEGFPIVGSASYCNSATIAGIPGTATNCTNTVPAGPSLPLTGNELIPADTALGSGLPPQTVLIKPSALKQYERAVLALTDAATITTADYNTSSFYTVTLGGNRTMNFPTNMMNGAGFRFVLTQDGTGSRTVTWATGYQWAGGTAPTLTTTAAHYDVISCFSITASTASCSSSLDVHH